MNIILRYTKSIFLDFSYFVIPVKDNHKYEYIKSYEPYNLVFSSCPIRLYKPVLLEKKLVAASTVYVIHIARFYNK